MTYKKLILSKRNGSDQFVRLGMLQFDDTNHASLATEGAGAAVDKLRQDWSEVSQRGELTWKMSVPGEEAGDVRIVGETVRPGEEDYIYAVLNTMERSYGYKAELAP